MGVCVCVCVCVKHCMKECSVGSWTYYPVPCRSDRSQWVLSGLGFTPVYVEVTVLNAFYRVFDLLPRPCGSGRSQWVLSSL